MALNHKILKKGLLLLKLFIIMLLIIFGIVITPFIIGLSHPFILTGLFIFMVITTLSVFWIGIILTYVSSIQLGLKTRLLGIAFGWIPIAHLILLGRIIRICTRELKEEEALIQRDELRAEDQVCDTRYPLLLVHGVFFRDFEHINYWGRIPRELEKNGARIFYGNHNSASSVENSARELEARIIEIVNETGCSKVNIIAHSKGGLDTRAAICQTTAGKYVASLTTINTPHRGCEFADYLLKEIPNKQLNILADTYNRLAVKLGDKDPDFISAVYALTSDSCSKRNEYLKDSPDVYYQSVGSVLKQSVSGRFPLNCTHSFVKRFDGDNDGLVGAESFPWGENYIYLENKKSDRGISHADVIDLNRENINGFDVREFYVSLVSDLKKKGF